MAFILERMTSTDTGVSTVAQKARAWSVHALTLGGLIWACLAIIALQYGNIKLMWLFLGIAMLADAADGPMARKFNVKKHTPNFDGSILDIVIDYLTWSFIPAYYLFTSGLLGNNIWSALMFILICVSSMFCYANVRMKTSENYFMGFPAAWNIVAVYIYILEPNQWVSIALIIFFALITVAPITFLHPFRVRSLIIPNVISTGIWLFGTICLVAAHPDSPLWVQLLWWISGTWFIVSGLLGGLLIQLSTRNPSLEKRFRSFVGGETVSS